MQRSVTPSHLWDVGAGGVPLPGGAGEAACQNLKVISIAAFLSILFGLEIELIIVTARQICGDAGFQMSSVD